MKQKLFRLIPLLLCAAMLCSCAPAETVQPAPEATAPLSAEPTAEPAAEPTAEPAETAAPSSKQEEREMKKGGWQEIWSILYDYGWIANTNPDYNFDFENVFLPAAKSALGEMTPYITALLESFDGSPAQKDVFFYNSENDNDINDKEYVAKAMENVIRHCGHSHPEAAKGLGSVITVPDSAVKEYMRVCFADYTDDMPIPEIEGLTHIDGTYRFEYYPDMLLYRTDYIILSMQHEAVSETNDKERFYMFVVHLHDADHFSGGESFELRLVKNDAPDSLGINWRVEKIFRHPYMENGWADGIS